jgi:hypothetical protein
MKSRFPTQREAALLIKKMRPRFVQLHPNGLAEPVDEPALGARSQDGFADTEIHYIVWALGLDQVNLCRDITWSLTTLNQYGLGSHTQRNTFLPCRAKATLRLGAKEEGILHSIKTNLSR